MKTASLAILAGLAVANPVPLEERQNSGCPKVHVFGARETTVSPGFGSSATVVNMVVQAYPGTTTEAINYPACGGQSSCGGASYDSSASQGTSAVVSQVNAFYQKCPQTQLVLVGYSQVSGETPSSYC
jgi:acetylxylan esterase